MEEKELWTLKYAPKIESDIVGNYKPVEEIKKFLTNWSSKNEYKALLLLGPPGCGKTTSTYLMANIYNYEVIEINASNVRNKKSIEQFIIPTVKTRTIKMNKRKLYLIDEVDGLSGNQDRGGLSAMLKAVKLSEFPIIFTANDISNSKFKSLKSKKNKVKTVKFRKIRATTIAKVLAKICKAEKIQADPKALKEIAENVNNDMRSAINDLQAIAEGKKKLSVNDVTQLQQVRDMSKTIYQVLPIIFENKDIKECNQAISELDLDWGLLLQWVNESLPHHRAAPDVLYDAYSSLSKADIIMNRIRSNPQKISWTMLPYFIDLISSGVTLPIKNQDINQNVHYYRNFPGFFFSSFRIFSGKLMDVVNKIRKKLKCDSREIVTKHLPYISLMLKKKSAISQELIDFYELDRRDITFIKQF
ncbi:MAG: replication factor C large subunit [Candidatus Lokiarchaeota archaeon]|nr:replication factor C large subunit [Candidatus Lokiarchaeota archaeon]